jgi:3-phenylpropionate/trans-cinnamate dioxygenase ferredoxin reductase subunit
MKKYTYLILGGGMTAAAAVRGIRSADPSGTIGLLSAEQHPPYKRPPLSKKLWAGKAESSIWLKLEEHDVSMHLGRTATQIVPAERRVVDDHGDSYGYETLLLATGGTPRRLPWDQGDDIIYFRTFADYQRLRELTSQGQRFAIIGGGFIGSELAAALRVNDKEVTMVFPGQNLFEHIFGADLSRFITDYYREKGVELITGDKPIGLERSSGGLLLRTEQGRELAVDGVIAGIGIVLNTQLAEAAGLQVDNGIVVDAHLRTNDPHIYAAGDVANVYSQALGVRRRVEHEDNANTMGRCAGRNMAGAAETFEQLPFFYSDLFELGYEAVGELDARHEMVVDWQEQYRKGVIYYLKEGRVRGVLLWNVWDQVDAARRLIASAGPFAAGELMGRLPSPPTAG